MAASEGATARYADIDAADALMMLAVSLIAVAH